MRDITYLEESFYLICLEQLMDEIPYPERDEDEYDLEGVYHDGYIRNLSNVGMREFKYIEERRQFFTYGYPEHDAQDAVMRLTNYAEFKKWWYNLLDEFRSTPSRFLNLIITFLSQRGKGPDWQEVMSKCVKGHSREAIVDYFVTYHQYDRAQAEDTPTDWLFKYMNINI